MSAIMNPSVARNLGQIGKNLGFSLAQDSSLLKSNAAILAGLGTVTARCTISAEDARKAAQEGKNVAYAKREAASTCLREIGGFLLSYLAIRAVDSGAHVGLNQLFNVTVKKPETTGFGQAIAQSLGVLRGSVRSIAKHPETFTGKTVFQVKPGGLRMQPLLHGLADSFASNEVAQLAKKGFGETAMKLGKAQLGHSVLTTWVPPLIGTAVGCYLSGWSLERLTLNDETREAVLNRMLGKKPEAKEDADMTEVQPEALLDKPKRHFLGNQHQGAMAAAAPAAITLESPRFSSAPVVSATALPLRSTYAFTAPSVTTSISPFLSGAPNLALAPTKP